MPLNIQVVDAAAVNVLLSARHTDIDGNTIALNDPNHVYDEVYIERVDIAVFSHLSNSALTVYHRLNYSSPSNPDFTWDVATPQNGVLNLIPIAGQPSTVHGGHTSTRIAYRSTDSNNNIGGRIIGKMLKGGNYSNLLRINFDLEYQEDDGSHAFSNAGTWTTYPQSSIEDVWVTGTDNETYKMRVVNSIIDKDDSGAVDIVYMRLGDTIPNTLTINDVTYTVVSDLSLMSDQVGILLYTGWVNGGPNTLGNLTPQGNLNYVLELADTIGDIGSSGQVDDVAEYTSAALPYFNIAEHIVNSLTDLTTSLTRTIKLFRGRTTKLYTDLRWVRVCLEQSVLSTTDSDYVSRSFEGLSSAGFVDWDNGETRIGVFVDTSRNNRVYLLVKLGLKSDGIQYNELRIVHNTSGRNRLVDFAGAPPNFDSSDYSTFGTYVPLDPEADTPNES